MTGKRQLQKERTQLHILETAYEVYASEGFSVSTGEIARRAGVSHGTVFLHFPTAVELQERVVEHFGDSIASRLHDLVQEDSGLEGLLAHYLDVISEHETFYWRLLTERPSLPQTTKQVLLLMQSTISVHFSYVLERGDCGVVGRVPHHMLFNTWMGLVQYYLVNKDFFVESEDESVIEAHRSELITTYLALIGCA